MADFIYQEPFPVGEDKTQYRLLTKDYVKVVECDGRKILKVDPAGLELLSKAAYSDVSFYLRAAHLQKLRNILDDPEATDNDKFGRGPNPPRARTPARPSASATRARTSIRAPTMRNTLPKACTRPTKTATCAIRRSCLSR